MAEENIGAGYHHGAGENLGEHVYAHDGNVHAGNVIDDVVLNIHDDAVVGDDLDVGFRVHTEAADVAGHADIPDDDALSSDDPRESYDAIDPNTVLDILNNLEHASQDAIEEIERHGRKLCDMSWDYFKTYFPRASYHYLNQAASVASIFGIDIALESFKLDEPLLQGILQKHRHSPLVEFLGKTKTETAQLAALRNYYVGFVQAPVDVAYALEKRNKYATNLLGLSLFRMSCYRNNMTDEYLKDEQKAAKLMEEREKEITELFRSHNDSMACNKAERDRQERLKMLSNEIKKLKKETTLEDKSFLKAATPLRKEKTSFSGESADHLFNKTRIRMESLLSGHHSKESLETPQTKKPAKPSLRTPSPKQHFEKKPDGTYSGRILGLRKPSKVRINSDKDENDDNSDEDYYEEKEDVNEQDDEDRTPVRQSRRKERGSPYRSPDKDVFGAPAKSSTQLSFPLSTYGHVSPHSVSYIRKRAETPVNKTNEERLSEVVKAMADNGIAPGHYTETNLTGAAIFMKYMDEYHKGRPSKKTEPTKIEKIDLEEQDLSVNSFDFNLHGTTPEDILGPRFMKTVFLDEVSRTETMRAILQYIVDHPECKFPTKGIVLNLLGRFDIAKTQKAAMALSTIQAMDAISSPRNTGQDEDLFISPPLLGNKTSYGTNLSKSVFLTIGLTVDDKFCLEDPNSKPLNLYLPSLKRIIEAEELNSDSAFTLLLSILKGDCFEEVHTQLREGDRTFEEVWMSLQKTSGRVLHTGGIEKTIQDILHKTPTCVPAALSRIQNLRTKMYSHVANKTLRQMKISDAVYRDFRQLIRSHLPLESVPIDWSFLNRKTAHAEETRLRQLQGLPPPRPFDEAQVYKEVACNYLASEVGSSPFPQVILQNSSSLPKKLTISEAELKPILKTPSNTEDRHSSHPSSHSEEGDHRGRTTTRSQGSSRSGRSGGSRSESGRSQSYEQGSRPNQGYSNNSSRSRENSGSRSQLYIPEIAANMLGERTCYLCKCSGHYSYHCTLYPGDTIRDGPPCPRCGAFHSSKCRSQQRTEIEQPKFINEDGSRVPYSQLPYVPGPTGQSPNRPQYRYNSPGAAPMGPVPYNRRRTTNFNGSPNYTSNPRLFDAYSDRRPQRAGPPRPNYQGNYQQGNSFSQPNYSNPPPRPNNRQDNQQFNPNPEYRPNQPTTDGAIGNSGVQRPPPNVFINSAQIQQSGHSQHSHETQDVRYMEHQEDDYNRGPSRQVNSNGNHYPYESQNGQRSN